MAIDFGLLNAQAPRQQVVARLPETPNPAQSLATGLLAGEKEGQAIASDKQVSSERAQLFPSILKEAQNKAAMSDLDLAAKQSAVKNALAVSTAFKQSWDAGMQTLKQNNPAGYLGLVKQQADISNTMSQVADKMATTEKTKLGVYNSLAINASKLAQSAYQAEQQQPGNGEIVYQQGLKMLGPSLAATLPAHFNETTHLALMGIGSDAVHQQAVDAFNKTATPEMKNAQFKADLQNAVASGKATPEQMQELNNITQAENSKGKTGQSNVDKIDVQTTAAELKNLDKQSDTARSSGITINMMADLSKQASVGSFAQQEMNGRKFVSAFSSLVGVPYDPNTSTDEAFKHLSTLARFDVLQNLRGRPNMTEFQQSLDSVPQITNTQKGRDLMISMAQYRNAATTAYADFSHAWSTAHNGNLDGRNAAWDNFQASIHSGYNPQTQLFDSNRLSQANFSQFISDPKMAEPGAVDPRTGLLRGQAAKPNAGQANAQNQEAGNNKTQPTFEEGKIYRDAQGNRAKYVAGQWQEIK